LRLKDE
jgi:hypothetical protein